MKDLFDNIDDIEVTLDSAYQLLNEKFRLIIDKWKRNRNNNLSQEEFDKLAYIHNTTGIKESFSRDDLYEFIQNHSTYETDVEFKDLNWIDVSDITDFSELFSSCWNIRYLDLSEWNMENAKTVSYMFYDSSFNGNISDWNLKNCVDFTYFLYNSFFGGNLSNWDLSHVNPDYLYKAFDKNLLKSDQCPKRLLN